jgi:hypothetical protein
MFIGTLLLIPVVTYRWAIRITARMDCEEISETIKA